LICHIRNSRLIEYLLVFSLFAIVRGAPELFASYPSGWDLVNYYAPWTVTYATYGLANMHFLGAPPLVFILLVTLYKLLGDVFLVLKIVAPVLYGLIGVSSLYFASNYLKFERKKRLIASIILLCQLSALRISSDLLKNEIGIVILFFLLVFISQIRNSSGHTSKRRTYAFVGMLSLLLVLSHQFVSIVYFIIIIFLFLKERFKGNWKNELILVNIPAFILFIMILGISTQWQPIVGPNQTPFSGGLFNFHRTIYYVDTPTLSFFCDYLKLFPSYGYLAQDILTIFTLFYIPYLPLVIFGFWNDSVLTPFTIFLMVGAFLPLISPFFAISDWYRWMFMLCYPFSFYITNGLFVLNSFYKENKKNVHRNRDVKNVFLDIVKSLSKMKIYVFLIILLSYTVLFVRGDLSWVIPSRAWGYTPPSMMISAEMDQTIIADAISNINWVNSFYLNNSGTIFQDDFSESILNRTRWTFFGTGKLDLGNSTLTLDTMGTYSNSFIEHNWRANQKGEIEIKARFNAYGQRATILDFIYIRDSNGYGGGIIYCNNNGKFSYWDGENGSRYDFKSIDNEWHTWKIACDGNQRRIFLDGELSLTLSTGKFFGYIALGESSMLSVYGGSSSFDFIRCSFSNPSNACLILTLREIGITWLNLNEEIQMVVFNSNISRAISYAFENKFTYVFFIGRGEYWLNRANASYEILHHGSHYSVYRLIYPHD